MPPQPPSPFAVVGVAVQANRAVLGTPGARALPLAEAVTLVHRVQALVTAGRARGWRVVEDDPAWLSPPADAAEGGADLAARLRELGRAAGPPWQAPHKLAAAAALRALYRP
ncbi:hypothetical protein L6R53_30310 [Myxococcota bacterium]|nr:hypothetical protein [Myxococcota bacterium]